MYCRVLLVLWGTAGYILATAGSVCNAGYCWYCGVLQGIYWVLRFLCVLPGTAGTVEYCGVYILGTAGSVCTAGYCWYCGVLWGRGGEEIV